MGVRLRSAEGIQGAFGGLLVPVTHTDGADTTTSTDVHERLPTDEL
jgi:hypothetical protein